MAFNKNRLQEVMAQEHLALPTYYSMAQGAYEFEERVQVRLRSGVELSAIGRGTTKRSAQDKAAEEMMKEPALAALQAARPPAIYKNRLQEVVMRPGSPWAKMMPVYMSQANYGFAGFAEGVTIHMTTGETYTETGYGTTKKGAQQEAAKCMLARINALQVLQLGF